VEGKDDKYLIERLYRDFVQGQDQYPKINKLWVDTAENLIAESSVSNYGNRAKVIAIAQSVKGKTYQNNFVGFADREFDQFTWDWEQTPELVDNGPGHRVDDRLVFSRGHSIENYLFQTPVLSEVLKILSTTPYAADAIETFETTFNSALSIACTLGLAAAKAQVLAKVNSTIDDQLFRQTSTTTVTFEFDRWIEKLLDREISNVQAENLKLHYTRYQSLVAQASPPLIRWICHGHLGFDCLKAWYQKCLVQISHSNPDPNKKRSTIAWADRELFKVAVNLWVTKIAQDQYPQVLFQCLREQVPEPNV
jgi:hypothetical protein